MGYTDYEKVISELYLNKWIKFRYSDMSNEELTEEASKAVREIADEYEETLDKAKALMKVL